MTAEDMTPKRDDWLIIGISGVTCGGKTTLAARLCSRLASVQVLHQDEYFYPDDSEHHVKCTALDHNNYDILSSVDMSRMLSDTSAILNGSRLGHASGAGAGRVRGVGKSVLVLEGFSVLNYRPLYDLCDLRYYVVLEYGECKSRRSRRNYSPPDCAGYFEQCAWPEHVRYRAELENDKTVTQIDGTRTDAFDIVMADLKKLGAEEITE